MIPGVFTPEGAPAGVQIRWLDRPDGRGRPLWQTRPVIRPRLLLLHTNGASGPGSIDAAFNWGNQYNGNTKPHYQVQRDGSAAKMLPSDRKGIGNYRAADFSLVVETQDLGYGYGRPGETVGYTDAQRDTIVRIVAYESMTHGFPLVVPSSWDGHGVASHTDPFGYPYWTNSRGKVCPGRAKKADLHRIIAEANDLVLRWITPPLLELDMDIKDYYVVTFPTLEPGAFLVGPGGPVHLTAQMRDEYKRRGAKAIESDNADVLASYKKHARA